MDLKHSPVRPISRNPIVAFWSRAPIGSSVYTKEATWEDLDRFFKDSRGHPISFITEELVLHDDLPDLRENQGTWLSENRSQPIPGLRGIYRLSLTPFVYSSILESLPNLRTLTLNSWVAGPSYNFFGRKIIQGKRLQKLRVGPTLWWWHPTDLFVFLLPFVRIDELVLDSMQLVLPQILDDEIDGRVREGWTEYKEHRVEVARIHARFTPLPPTTPYIARRDELEIPYNLGWNVLVSIVKPRSLRYLKSREAAAFYPLELSEEFFRAFGPGLHELDCGTFCCSSDAEAPLYRQTNTIKHIPRLVQFCRGIDRLCFRVEPRGGYDWPCGIKSQPRDEGWSIAMETLKRAEPRVVEITIHLVLLFDKYDGHSDECCRRQIQAAAHKLDYTLLHAIIGKLPALREVTFRVGLRPLAVDKLDAPLAHHADEAVRVVQSLIDASNPARHYPDLRTRLSWTYVTDTHSP